MEESHDEESADPRDPSGRYRSYDDVACPAVPGCSRRLSLSDDIRKYMIGEYPNLEFGGRPILVSDLLDHRSGLPFLLPDRSELAPDYKGDARPYTVRVNAAMQGYGRAQFLSDLHSVKLTAMPGSHYQ